MKVWDIKTKKLMFDLPGHADEVYGVDWSPDGLKVCSGGKDKLLKIWKNWSNCSTFLSVNRVIKPKKLLLNN